MERIVNTCVLGNMGDAHVISTFGVCRRLISIMLPACSPTRDLHYLTAACSSCSPFEHLLSLYSL